MPKKVYVFLGFCEGLVSQIKVFHDPERAHEALTRYAGDMEDLQREDYEAAVYEAELE